MPDPHDTLIVFAEVSVALAGFSGIVIAFGRRSHGALTPLEKRRLSNMFTFSGLVLITFLLGVSLLHWERMDAETIWRGGSGLMFMIGVPWLVLEKSCPSCARRKRTNQGRCHLSIYCCCCDHAFTSGGKCSKTCPGMAFLSGPRSGDCICISTVHIAGTNGAPRC